MARRRNRTTVIYNRGGYGAWRRGRGYRRSYFVGSNKGTGLKLTMPFLAGVAGSFVIPASSTNGMVDTAIIAAAVAPVSGIGTVKGAAQGYILGKLLQTFIGNPLAQSGNSGNNVVV